MVYRLLGWGVVGGVYHKIQIVSCASAMISINLDCYIIVHWDIIYMSVQ